MRNTGVILIPGHVSFRCAKQSKLSQRDPIFYNNRMSSLQRNTYSCGYCLELSHHKCGSACNDLRVFFEELVSSFGFLPSLLLSTLLLLPLWVSFSLSLYLAILHVVAPVILICLCALSVCPAIPAASLLWPVLFCPAAPATFVWSALFFLYRSLSLYPVLRRLFLLLALFFRSRYLLAGFFSRLVYLR